MEAADAGARALASITERELANLSSDLKPRSQRAGEPWLTAVAIPEGPELQAIAPTKGLSIAWLVLHESRRRNPPLPQVGEGGPPRRAVEGEGQCARQQRPPNARDVLAGEGRAAILDTIAATATRNDGGDDALASTPYKLDDPSPSTILRVVPLPRKAEEDEAAAPGESIGAARMITIVAIERAAD